MSATPHLMRRLARWINRRHAQARVQQLAAAIARAEHERDAAEALLPHLRAELYRLCLRLQTSAADPARAARRDPEQPITWGL